jgi:Uncharacterized protein conserved in bacteria
MTTNYSKDIQIACGALLLAVAEADEILEMDELEAVQDILIDFFNIMPQDASQILEESRHMRKHGTGLFEPGKLLNQTFDFEEKLDFIHCIYEVGYSDGALHHLEDFVIKQIANVLHIEQADLVHARSEVRNWFK